MHVSSILHTYINILYLVGIPSTVCYLLYNYIETIKIELFKDKLRIKVVNIRKYKNTYNIWLLQIVLLSL